MLFSGPVITFWCALCGGFFYSAANFLRSALQNAFGLLSVSFLLLLLRRASLLPVSTFVSVQHLFPLGLLVGFLERSLLPGSICVFIPVLAFVVLLLGTLCLIVFRLVHISQTWVTLGGSFQGSCCAGAVHSCSSCTFTGPGTFFAATTLSAICCAAYAGFASSVSSTAMLLSSSASHNTCREVILLALRLGIPWSSSTIVVCGS